MNRNVRGLANGGSEQHLNTPMAVGQPSTDNGNPTAIVRRIPESTLNKLEVGFEQLENTLKSLSEETALPVLHIINLWSSKEGRHLSAINLWNIYQTYLTANADEELNSTFGDATKGKHLHDRTCADNILMFSVYSN
jgi:hypothetical protein